MSTNFAIEIKNLSKSFGKRKVIDNISLKVEQGDVFGFLGQNGSGKTTTIRMLLNLIHEDNGVININGYNIKNQYKDAIEKVGAVVELPKFHSYLSAYQNLRLMGNLIPNFQKDKINQVLQLVGLSHRAKDKVGTYSLGMKQRLGIANALLNDPTLIILDEPTNGLDPQGMKEIRDMILDLADNHKITFFISTHLLYEVEQICNKVAILHEGKIIAEGNVTELLNKDTENLEVQGDICEEILKATKDLNYVKSLSKTSKGVRFLIDKGYSYELNKFLFHSGAKINYVIPNKQSLEEYFIELTKGGPSID